VIEQIEEVIPPMRSAEWFDHKKKAEKKGNISNAG
jgi:hypothetical protein